MSIILSADECTGCRVCELVCSIEKQAEYNPKKSFIKVLSNSEFSVFLPVLKRECDFCGKCIEMCPTGALAIADLGQAAIIRLKSKIGRFPIPVVK